MPSRPIKLIHALVAVTVSVLLTVLFGLWFTKHETDIARKESARAVALAEQKARDDLRQWCGLLVTLDEAYNDPSHPPTTELGRTVAARMHDLRVAFDCH